MSLGLTGHESLEHLSDDVRRALVEHWLRRSGSEWQVGLAFQALASLSAGLSEPLVTDMLRRSSQQELEHAQLCHELSQVYAGRALPEPQRPAAPLPDFHAASPELELTLQLVGLCCINETLATAWLRHCLRLARVPFAVQANRRHLRDEIDHARLGWAHLASRQVGPDQKREIAARLPRLIEVNLAQWERPQNYLPDDALAAHGQPSAEQSRRVLRDAVQQVLLPGFAHVGIPALVP